MWYAMNFVSFANFSSFAHVILTKNSNFVPSKPICSDAMFAWMIKKDRNNII